MNLDEIEARANAATPGPWRDQHHECSEVWGSAPDSQTHSMQIARIGRAQFDARNAAFIANARTDVPALIARVRELEERLLTAEERLEQRTRERDHERATLAGVLANGGFTYSEGEVALRAQAAEAQQLAKQMMDERDDECIALRAECERLRTFAAQNFSAMIRQEAEQMREYGLSYEGVRKVLREHDDGEISFGKLMDLIRAAARAMAEDMRE
jgi:hypothetical protein